jgi:hypothetical protein
MEVRRYLKFALIAVLVMVVPVLIGCGTTSLKGSLLKPHQAFSIPSLDEIEKTQSMKVITFKGYMNPSILTETVNGGGVWKAEILTEDGRILEGIAIIGEVDPYFNFILEFMIFNPEGQSSESRIKKALYYNRAESKVFNVFGKNEAFDKARNKKDESYRKQTIERCGTSSAEINDFWNKYYSAIGYEVEKGFPHIEVLQVGTNRWVEYKKYIATIMGFYYKLPTGEVRQSYLPEDLFAFEASRNHGLTFMQRFIKHWNPGVSMADLQLPGSGFATSAISAALKASFDKTVTGYYDNAQVERGDLAPVFENVVRLAKMMLVARDRINAQLKMQNAKLWTVVNSLAGDNPAVMKAVTKELEKDMVPAKAVK